MSSRFCSVAVLFGLDTGFGGHTRFPTAIRGRLQRGCSLRVRSSGACAACRGECQEDRCAASRANRGGWQFGRGRLLRPPPHRRRLRHGFDLVEDAGVHIVGDLPSINVVYGTGPARAFEQLSGRPEVTRLEFIRPLPLNLETATCATRVTPMRQDAGGLDLRVPAPTVPLDGSGVGIAIVDSGIAGQHPDLDWCGNGPSRRLQDRSELPDRVHAARRGPVSDGLDGGSRGLGPVVGTRHARRRYRGRRRPPESRVVPRCRAWCEALWVRLRRCDRVGPRCRARGYQWIVDNHEDPLGNDGNEQPDEPSDPPIRVVNNSFGGPELPRSQRRAVEARQRGDRRRDHGRVVGRQRRWQRGWKTECTGDVPFRLPAPRSGRTTPHRDRCQSATTTTSRVAPATATEHQFESRQRDRRLHLARPLSARNVDHVYVRLTTSLCPVRRRCWLSAVLPHLRRDVDGVAAHRGDRDAQSGQPNDHAVAD